MKDVRKSHEELKNNVTRSRTNDVVPFNAQLPKEGNTKLMTAVRNQSLTVLSLYSRFIAVKQTMRQLTRAGLQAVAEQQHSILQPMEMLITPVFGEHPQTVSDKRIDQ